ncbi:MAG: GNAT family N-acetyltransferase [Pseudomonadota bacterium]
MNLYQLHHIETPRLIIRPVQLGDEFALHESIERSAVALRRWMPWARDTSFNATQQFVHGGYEHWQAQTSKDFPLIVIHKESQKIISVSGYNEHTDLVRPCFEIGYWIDSRFEGQGLAKELVNALTRYALDGLKAIRAQICTQIENEKSAAVATRSGYVFEAKLHNICLDCSTKLPSDGLLFSCTETTMLSPLEVSWEQDLSVKIKEVPTEEHFVPKPVFTNAEKLPVMQTKRLCLRAPRMQDTEKLYTALMASLNEVSPFFSWAKKDLTRRQLQKHVNEGTDAGNDVLASEYIFFLVWDRDQKNVLGEVWFKVTDWAVPSLQLGYWLDTRHVGHGYAFEAVFAVIRYAFAKRNAKSLQLYISQENARSLNLAKRLGFHHEGTLKNYFRNFVTQQISDAELFAMIDYSQLRKENQ